MIRDLQFNPIRLKSILQEKPTNVKYIFAQWTCLPWANIIFLPRLTLLTKEIGVCQPRFEVKLEAFDIVGKYEKMHRFQLIHLPNPKYKVSYYVYLCAK